MATIREVIDIIQVFVSSQSDVQAPLEWNQRIIYNVNKARELYHDFFLSCTVRKTKDHYGLNSNDDDNDEWIFVTESISLLLYLVQDHLSNEEKEEEILLSISDEKIIRSLSQFLSALGLYVNLDPAVGMAITTKAPPTKRTDLPVSVREERLYKTLSGLMVCIKNPTLGPLLVPSLLSNMIAGLLQINYKPTCSLSISERVWSKEELHHLLKSVPLSLLVRELLTIQGSMRRSGEGRRGLSWLKQACGIMLSQILMERNGVQFVLRGIFEASTGSTDSCGGGGRGVVESVTEVSENVQKCQAIGQILSSCPKQAKSVQQYYSLVCPQILDLFRLPADGIGRQFLRVAVSSLTMMLSKEKELTIQFLVRPLLSPLVELYNDKVSSLNFTGFQERLMNCLSDTNRILAIIEPSSPLLTILVSYLPLLFDIWKVSRNKCSSLSSQVKAVLLSVLKTQDTVIQLSFFKHLFHQDNCSTSVEEESSFYSLKSNLQLTVTEQGELIVVERKQKAQSLFNSETMEDIGCCMSELLNDMTSLVMTLFLYCLEHMSCLLANESGVNCEMKKENNDFDKKGSNVLLHWEHELNQSNSSSDKARFTNALILYMMASLCESMDPESSLQEMNLESMLISLVVIVRAHAVWSQKKREVKLIITTENNEQMLTGGHVTLSVAFGLLSALLTMKQIDRSLRPLFTSLLPYLEVVSKGYPGQEELTELAEDLRICIVTLGSVWSVKMSEKVDEVMASSGSIQEKPLLIERPLIEEIKSPSPTTTSSKEGSPFQKALQDIQHPLLPVKAHGLRTLGQLARHKDDETLANIDSIFTIFSSHMDHTDSYIYLVAIQGLVELADVRPQLVIPHLCREYGQFGEHEIEKEENETGQYYKSRISTGSSEGKVERSVEWRVKLGEALVQISREVGDLLPSYSQCLLSSVLSTARHDDPLIRTSALSNLAQICNNLKWSFVSVENEVIVCLSQILQHDSQESVKRGAIEVITQLFKGMGTEIDQILHGESLKTLYRLLKEVESSTNDPLTQTHAQSALGQLDDIMRLILFPPVRSLSKKISILDSMV